jgi:hypothetical protein
MTAAKQGEATPWRNDEAFKWEAVRLWQTSGRSAESMAGELGISVLTLNEWGQEGTSSLAESGRAK